MTAVGVLCARVRVEEKQIIAALADAGVVAMPVPPASTPLPPGPAPTELAALGAHQRDDDLTQSLGLGLVIDRCQDRHVAAATLPLLKLSGIGVLDAGLAAVSTRLEVATALAQAGLPRPHGLIGFSEASALQAAVRLGYPATLMPQTPSSTTTSLLDHDTAEAVIEHRVVLGSHGEAIVLLQAGAPREHQLGRHHVIDGQVIAVEGALVADYAQELAIAAARAVGAGSVAIDIAQVSGRVVIWDVTPVADFRNATLIGARSVAHAIADLVCSGWDLPIPMESGPDVPVAVAQQGWEAQVKHGAAGVSLTA